MTWLSIASVKLMACRASNSGFSNQINAMARCRGDLESDAKCPSEKIASHLSRLAERVGGP